MCVCVCGVSIYTGRINVEFNPFSANLTVTLAKGRWVLNVATLEPNPNPLQSETQIIKSLLFNSIQFAVWELFV